ncbi:MAG: baseplate J/gp47 family protein [Lachnospiraceae bacterium]
MWKKKETKKDVSPDSGSSGRKKKTFICHPRKAVITLQTIWKVRLPFLTDETGDPHRETEIIRIRYRCGGGKEGNQTEEAINQMSRSLGYVNKVFNPCITTGGNDQETVDEAILRSSAALCHRGRAVTVRDYEALALEASRDVLKVKCFPNCSESGGREPGSVTLVVLQKNFQDGRLYFDQVKTQVERYMNPRLEGNQAAMGRFYVAEPRFLKLECRMEVVVLDFNDVFDVKKQVSERIREFLDPITGNFNKKGWEIGRIPNEVQIGNALKGIPGIHYIKELRMSAFMQSREGWIEVDQDSADLRRFAVAVNGSHQIMITVENG